MAFERWRDPEARTTVTSGTPNSFTVWGHARPRPAAPAEVYGRLIAREPEGRLREDCVRNLASLGREVGMELDVLIAHDVSIEPEFFNVGLGLALYLRALQHASSREDPAALMPDECDEGETSPDAVRAWDRLRRVPGVASAGRAFFWTGAESDSVGPMPAWNRETPTEAELRRAMEAINAPAGRRGNPPGTIIEPGREVAVGDGSILEFIAITGGRRSGVLDIATYPVESLAQRGALVGCWQGFETVQRRVRRSGDLEPVNLCAVRLSSVETFALNRGVGVALYIEAARVARERFHAAITSHRCVGGTTSVEANRVWNSRRFRAEVRVAGKVGWWVGPGAGALG